MKERVFTWVELIGVNLIYACTAIFTKMASLQSVPSIAYVFWIIGAILILGLYALLWQQIIRKMPLSTAYMFKGTSLIFVLLFSALLFKETIYVNNILGSLIIVIGIIQYAKE